ncbi:MAG: hypothetical protein AVDCRST_MAG77-490 [uncultured Chloroflexi bacterium]|uniref:Uncharacterized protein n=1 Tax=uncultured Chloroflexota bacterium TaxID=166587 RepID=A0A6J4HDF4_9CHLR|nr:MAG: hypothetical protein AVDCRST_MAG77-490 [uncultured Chloroflexota bacterium]
MQVDPAMDYPVLVILTGGEVGDTVGFIDYPSFPCGGPVVLLEVTDEYVDLAEQMEFGTYHCVSGAVRLQLRAAARLDYQWRLADGTLMVTAILSRRPPR